MDILKAEIAKKRKELAEKNVLVGTTLDFTYLFPFLKNVCILLSDTLVLVLFAIVYFHFFIAKQ